MNPEQIMKDICLERLDQETWNAQSENRWNRLIDEYFADDHALQENDPIIVGRRFQSARDPASFRWKNGGIEQKRRAALHAAEFAAWQATGGDFLRSGLVRSNIIELGAFGLLRN
jgi:hypothetical protein